MSEYLFGRTDLWFCEYLLYIFGKYENYIKYYFKEVKFPYFNRKYLFGRTDLWFCEYLQYIFGIYLVNMRTT